jgi:hypothetical protein
MPVTGSKYAAHHFDAENSFFQDDTHPGVLRGKQLIFGKLIAAHWF